MKKLISYKKNSNNIDNSLIQLRKKLEFIGLDSN